MISVSPWLTSILLAGCMLFTGALDYTAIASDELTLRFRKEPRCQSQVVRLGDLVEVLSGGSKLGNDVLELPLSPAPRKGVKQDWTSRDVIRHLELRGIEPATVRWVGNDAATLMFVEAVAEPELKSDMTPAFVQQRTVSQAQQNVAQAVKEYLWLQSGEQTDYRISLQVPAEHAPGLYARRNIEAIGGGKAPWQGVQEFVVAYRHQNKLVKFTFSAAVELPPMVVTAARPLRRDEVIDASMLAYGPLNEKTASQQGEYFSDMQELIGKQLRKSISAGLPLSRGAIGAPIIIASGEVVKIEAIAGGIVVTTAGRALSAGAVGDSIQVEVLGAKKERILANVAGPRIVRIHAHTDEVPSDSESAVVPATRASKSEVVPSRFEKSRS